MSHAAVRTTSRPKRGLWPVLLVGVLAILVVRALLGGLVHTSGPPTYLVRAWAAGCAEEAAHELAVYTLVVVPPGIRGLLVADCVAQRKDEWARSVYRER